MSELLACRLGVEHPLDPSLGIVTFLYPDSDLRDQFLALADASIEALTAEDADLHLHHIEPAGVLGCVVDLYPLAGSDAPPALGMLHTTSPDHGSTDCP